MHISAQYQGKFSIFDYVLGFREDDNEETGKQDTSNFTLGAQLGKEPSSDDKLGRRLQGTDL